MKNLIIIALSSLLLFSVSAGLSLWLRQSKEDAAQAENKKAPKENKDAARESPTKPVEHSPEKETAKSPPIAPAPSPNPAEDISAKRDRLDKLKHQFQIVQHDLRLQQDLLGKLLEQVAAESKAVKAMADDAENRAIILKGEKETAEKALARAQDTPPRNQAPAPAADPYDAANLEKTALIMEKLDPEVAAGMLQSMADKGNLDSAVRVLGKMKDTKVASILSAMPDKDFGTQLVNKILASRTSKIGDSKK